VFSAHSPTTYRQVIAHKTPCYHDCLHYLHICITISRTPSISQPSTPNLHRSSMGNVLVPQLCLEIGVPGYLWIKYTAPRLGYLKYFEPYCCSDAPQFSLPSAFPWFRVCLGLSWLAWGLLLCTVCTACTLTIRVTRFHFHFHSIALL